MRTKEELISEFEKLGSVIWKCEEYIRSLVTYPDSPRRPSRPTKDNSETLTVYLKEIKGYEINKGIYDREWEEAQAESEFYTLILAEYMKELSGLNDIPEQYRNKVYCYAWSEYHSNGLSEIYNHLLDLVDIFKV